MELSNEGKLLAYIGNNKLLKIIRISKDKCLPIKLIEVLEEVTALAFSFHGKMLAYTT